MVKKADRKTLDVTFTLLGLAVTVILFVAGCIGMYAYNFATSTVRSELVQQKIFFPPAGSPGLSASEFPDLQKYGGQQVDDGIKAKAYANGFIGRHLDNVANGKTYSEVSAESKLDPTNAKLTAQKATLFQGETLRGILLGDGYAYWTFGLIAYYASIVALTGSAVMLLLVILGYRHILGTKN
ncbi:MAG: hypothetical protein WCK69_02275 [Candidatus Saccharibacteria bacterium]